MAGVKMEMESDLLTNLVKVRKIDSSVLWLLGAMVSWGIFAWVQQLRQGMAVTGLGDQVFWGINMANFLFFVRVSLAGTFLSVLLRIMGYNWQVPITRLAEVISVSALLVAGTILIADIGRPERLLNILFFGRLQSPLTWEAIVFTIYLGGSLLYLYLRLIPDLALYRDRLGQLVSARRHNLYRKLALGWRNTPAHQQRLDKLVNLMGLLIVLSASSTLYVINWLHTISFRWSWNNAIAPYFAVSGFTIAVAVVILITTALRHTLQIEKYLKLEEQFYRLGWLLLSLIALSAFVSFFELLQPTYAGRGQEREHLALLFTGIQSTPFWSSILGSLIIPAFLVCWPRTRTVAGLTGASVLVIIGAWINKSYLFVVATLQVPLMPFYGLGIYNPTWVEWSMTLAAIAGFLLLIVLFCRVFPAVAISELVAAIEK